MTRSIDVAVVGAGPGGLRAAQVLAEQGARCWSWNAGPRRWTQDVRGRSPKRPSAG